MKFSEASRVSGVSPRSLRNYEDEGLIVPGRFSNGFRDYCQSTLDRVLVIRSLLESGLPVRLIKEVLCAVGATCQRCETGRRPCSTSWASKFGPGAS